MWGMAAGQVERSICWMIRPPVPIQRAKPSRCRMAGWRRCIAVRGAGRDRHAHGRPDVQGAGSAHRQHGAATDRAAAPTEDLKDLAKNEESDGARPRGPGPGCRPRAIAPERPSSSPMQLDCRPFVSAANFGYAPTPMQLIRPARSCWWSNSSTAPTPPGRSRSFSYSKGISWRQVPEESAKSPLQSTPLNASADQMESNAAVAGQLPGHAPRSADVVEPGAE